MTKKALSRRERRVFKKSINNQIKAINKEKNRFNSPLDQMIAAYLMINLEIDKEYPDKEFIQLEFDRIRKINRKL